MKWSYCLPFKERRRLRDRSLRAQTNGQSEVAGVFACDENGRIRLEFLTNESKNAGHFEVSTAAVSAVRKRIRADGYRWLGLFHSHPIGLSEPSRGDISRSPRPWLLLVYDVCGAEVGLWRVKGDGPRRTAERVFLLLETATGRFVTANRTAA